MKQTQRFKENEAQAKKFQWKINIFSNKNRVQIIQIKFFNIFCILLIIKISKILMIFEVMCAKILCETLFSSKI